VTADTGSFSEAARQSVRLGAVGGISKRIDQLEWRIRAPLFTRTTRKLTLTDVGERYLPTVRQLVRQMEEMLAGMAQASGDLEGHIRIKIPTTLGTLYLSDMLSEFLQEQPRISMDVVLADRSVNPLEEGFDLAIGALPELYGQVKDHPLVPDWPPLVCCTAYLARRGTPQQATELIDHDCLVFTTSGAHWEFQEPAGAGRRGRAAQTQDQRWRGTVQGHGRGPGHIGARGLSGAAGDSDGRPGADPAGPEPARHLAQGAGAEQPDRPASHPHAAAVASAASSLTRASTQRAPSAFALSSRTGAWVLR
jgi:DNA-binding transcriptional LysR family regulator